jgi:photosystem II stability/assembly factor-like uncharacterized protein
MVFFAKMPYLSRTPPSAALALVALVLPTLAGAAVPAAAVPGTWTASGPEGGTVLGIATSPVSGVTYAATANGGVFRRVPEREAAWEPARVGLPLGFYRSIHTLVIAPGNPDTLYAFTYPAVYRSHDGAASWSAATLQGQFLGAAVAPSDAATVYVLDPDAGVRVSTDAGMTWQTKSQGLAQPYLYRTIVVHPADPRTAYVAGLSSVFKTTDGGGHWSATGAVPLSLEATAGAIDPRHPATVYFGGQGGGQGAVVKSDDGGESWREISHGRFLCSSLAMARSDPSRLYCGGPGGVARTQDGGATWQLSLLPEQVDAVAVDPADPNRVTVGLERLGAWQSRDGGGIWRPLNRGLRAATVTLVAADPHVPGTLYAAAEAGIELSHLSLGLLKSADGGASWSAPGSGPIRSGLPDPVRQIVFEPRTPGVFYATGAALYKTGDGGATWKTRMRGLAGQIDSPLKLALDPRNPDVLYLAGFTEFCPPDAENCENDHFPVYSVARSPDGGAHWEVLASDALHGPQPPTSAESVPVWTSIVVAPDGTLYLGGSQLLASGDGGASWAPLPSPPGVTHDTPVTRLFLVPGPDGRGGAGPSVLYAVVAIRTNPFPGTPDRLFASFDGGHSWRPADAGLTPAGPPVAVYVADLVAATKPARALFAATDFGVFSAPGRGLRWTALDPALPDPDVHALAVDPFTGALIAGTEGEGGFFVLNRSQ